MPPERASDEERARVRGEDGEQHRHHGPEAELGDVADEQEAADARPDPGDPEQRDAERRRRGLPHAPEAVDDESEQNVASSPPSIHSRPPSWSPSSVATKPR